MITSKQILFFLLFIWGLLICYRVLMYEKPKTAPLRYVTGQTVGLKSTKQHFADSSNYDNASLLKRGFKLLDERQKVSIGVIKPIFTPFYTINKDEESSTKSLPENKAYKQKNISNPPTEKFTTVMDSSKDTLSITETSYINPDDFPLQFLGMLIKDGRRKAFVVPKQAITGTEVFIVQEGDTLAGEFLVEKVERWNLYLTTLTDKIQIKLTLTEEDK